MKKLISTILALSMLLTMCIPAFATDDVFGDVNGDGLITAVDARIILQVVAGSKEETEIIKNNGDLNNDGNVTAVDARIILQVVAEIIPAPERPEAPENPETPEESKVSVSETEVYVKDSPVVVYVTMIGDGTIVYEIEDTNVVSCDWGEWDGDVIPLTIYPESDGKTTIEVYAKGYDERVEIKVTVDITEPVTPPSDAAARKLKKYIMTYGLELTDKPGTYGIIEKISGNDTIIYYFSKEDKFRFVCNIELDSAETLVFMDYESGAETQDVMTSTSFYSGGKDIVTVGYVYTSTYTRDGNVYLTSYSGANASDARAITSGATEILMMSIDMLLLSTGTDVTLNSLGFKAW